MKNNELRLSSLPKTWIFDLDGTIVKHNGYLIDGNDTLLDGAKELFDKIPPSDYILITTSRKLEWRELTVNFLKANNIRYNSILWEMPIGERILVNDMKPSGMKTAFAINKQRDAELDLCVVIDANS